MLTVDLEVFLNDMRYINPRFTYLLTYLTLGLEAWHKGLGLGLRTHVSGSW